ncbi:2-oxo acid dehydrogenase subunit E2 [Streptomyces silvisoli]|uniref:Dihydrolipoamide acetyltransferase component of pyruvate dehydrogenase complex n=1 Tax=Streptomyces silvisoli TaxID=3034235 RepID=A0ABT5ZKC5_9ACTN|nr:2-oxo acid dehydrogenase subunit E2 [Streptomyces silvisoli]MDF3290283.1 2-oxo acid dehydrogenase subunit E2 [Streptomyces silvisoli]
MPDVTVPKLNSNDASYTLVEWLAPEGHRVSEGEAVAVIETSKATTDLGATHSGVLRHHAAPMQQIAPGEVIGALLSEEEYARQPVTVGSERAASAHEPEVVITRPAAELMARHVVSEESVRGLGKRIVRRSDIEAMVERGDLSGGSSVDGVEIRALSAGQRAVAVNVAKSHRGIPSAFTVIKVYGDGLIRARQRVAEGTSEFLGLVEFVVRAIARQRADFPEVFADLRADSTLSIAPGAHVGVTVDVGRGLYLPIVRDAAEKSLPEISGMLMEFRVKALRGRFSEADLTGGNIALAVHVETDVVDARPIIFPGHVCVLSLCSMQEELHRTTEGSIETRSFFNLGLTYDHRVINGRESMRFLQAVKRDLESLS